MKKARAIPSLCVPPLSTYPHQWAIANGCLQCEYISRAVPLPAGTKDTAFHVRGPARPSWTIHRVHHRSANDATREPVKHFVHTLIFRLSPSGSLFKCQYRQRALSFKGNVSDAHFASAMPIARQCPERHQSRKLTHQSIPINNPKCAD